ncbi:TPA: hypothetical protein ACGZ9U_003698 [Elizabethkingia anophelis]
MARINKRPDIIYVKDMSEEDKNSFEKILKAFNTTNNGNALKRLIKEYLILLDESKEKDSEIKNLNKKLQNAMEDKVNFIKNKENLIKAFSVIEEEISSTKKDLTKLK